MTPSAVSVRRGVFICSGVLLQCRVLGGAVVGALPASQAVRDWQLLFATELHGYSLWTLYRRARRKGPVLLVAMDEHRRTFGAFVAGEGIRGTDARGYYGGGETFLMQVHPDFAVHRWTARNSQFVVSAEEYLGFGGGGAFGLWLDGALCRGTSERSPTFDNPCLAASDNFKIVSVEVWGFVLRK